LIGLAAATALSGCGSPAGGEPGTSVSADAGTNDSASGSAYVTKSQSLLDTAHKVAVTGNSAGIVAAEAIVPWKASDMPQPTAPSGKSLKVNVVYGIPVGYAPYAGNMLKALGAKLGWEVKVFQAASPAQTANLAAMQQARLDKPDAIISIVVPGVWVAPALEQARKDGIHTVNVYQDSSTGKGYDAYVPAAQGVQKALLGAWAVAKSEGSAHTVAVEVPGFSDATTPSAVAFLKGCGGCRTEVQDFNPDVPVDPIKAQSGVSAALSSRTGVDYLIWPEGGLPLSPVLNGIKTSRNPKTQLLVNSASPEDVQLLKDGKLPLVVQMPGALLVLEAVDNVIRLTAGQEALAEDALRLPVSYWTQGEAPAADFRSITAVQLEANDWLSPFEEAWDVQLKELILGVEN
jgi:ABC-type sugar transport system substrate-binding protein